MMYFLALLIGYSCEPWAIENRATIQPKVIGYTLTKTISPKIIPDVPVPPKVNIAPASIPKMTPGPGEHSHRCAHCGTTWIHTDSSYNSRPDHTCPNCGYVEWNVYQRGPPSQQYRPSAVPQYRPMSMGTFCPT